MVSRRSCDLCHITSLPACRKWDMGYAGNGTCQILVPIRLSIFRDRISEPRYCDPYLQNNNFTNHMQIAFHDYVTVPCITGELILISLYIQIRDKLIVLKKHPVAYSNID
jgi:hypothetical protein